MTTSSTQNAILELNAQYLENTSIIHSLETKLKQGLQELTLPQEEFTFAIEFIEDHVTLFRFLKDSDFNEDLAYERLLDTILWRKEIKINELRWDTIHTSFYRQSQNAFAFFHKQDRLDRPIAVIRMRHFPNFGDQTLAETIPPFACLVMEMARKWTRDLTRRNEQLRLEGSNTKDLTVLVSQIVVIIDISKSPMVPLEKRLIQELRMLTDDRFPGFIGSVYIMNFGWMYQGLWQMVKLMLSERAKSKINFPSANEVKEYISEENLLQELGGDDDYEWTLDNDIILQQYGNGWEKEPKSPLITEDFATIRPTRSLSLSSYASDDFYDAPESPFVEIDREQPIMGKTPSGYSSLYGTPGSLTPIGIRSPSQWPSTSQSLFPISSSTNQYFRLNGIHLPSFLSSFFGTNINTATTTEELDHSNNSVCGVDLTYRLTNIAIEQQQQLENNIEAVVMVEKRTIERHEPHFPHLLPANDPQSTYANAPLKLQLRRSEQRLVRITRRLFRLSFAYNGTFYWILLYIFLRGPVEHSMKQFLAKILKNPRTITYTTVGLTASMAAGLSASLSSSLGH